MKCVFMRIQTPLGPRTLITTVSSTDAQLLVSTTVYDELYIQDCAGPKLSIAQRVAIRDKLLAREIARYRSKRRKALPQPSVKLLQFSRKGD